MDFALLSKQMANVLRHSPWMYELEPDDDGWVLIEHLLAGLRAEPGLDDVTRNDLDIVNQQTNPPRYELTEDRIRPLFGFSPAARLRKEHTEPPKVLYHGTATEGLPLIRYAGIRPVGRKFVHLSVDQSTAVDVGRRKGIHVVLLTVDSAAASAAGVAFYTGNAKTWLADEIPPEYFTFQYVK